MTVARACPACHAPVSTRDTFCEGCGHRLDGRGTAVSAAEGEDRAGSGTGPAAPAERDHVEVDEGRVAGVSDRGLRHARNEDAMSLLAPDGRVPALVAVVCDGVSTSPRPDDASLVAARTGTSVLAGRLAAGAAPEEATGTAMARAAAAVTGLAGAEPAGYAPACTFVSAVVVEGGGTVTVGWVGDSRAYWLAGAPSATPSALLTRDDSWGEALVSAEIMTPEEARGSAHAHALTAWLGADADAGTGTGTAPGHVSTAHVTGPGAVLLCTDGLWNYLPEPDDLAATLPIADGDPLRTARAAVHHALEAGGRDNVTAVALAVPAPARPGGTP